MLLIKSSNSKQQVLDQALKKLTEDLHLKLVAFDAAEFGVYEAEMVVFLLDQQSRLKLPLLQEGLLERKIKTKVLETENYGLFPTI